MGNLTLRRNGGPFRETDDAALAQALAGQVSLAIHLSRLAQQARQEARQAAVLEERNRFARDLHDAMGQTFTGISIQLERAKAAVPTKMKRRKPVFEKRVTWHTQGWKRPASRSGLYAPIPVQGHFLRSPSTTWSGSIPSAQRFLRSAVFRERLFRLPSEMQDHLLRIVQEGLTNVLKHANARLRGGRPDLHPQRLTPVYLR